MNPVIKSNSKAFRQCGCNVQGELLVRINFECSHPVLPPKGDWGRQPIHLLSSFILWQLSNSLRRPMYLYFSPDRLPHISVLRSLGLKERTGWGINWCSHMTNPAHVEVNTLLPLLPVCVIIIILFIIIIIIIFGLSVCMWSWVCGWTTVMACLKLLICAVFTCTSEFSWQITKWTFE